ncbi:hypothetical protein G7O57_000006 [Salmonella enterica]|nr:hypothetical protein [Salmonella enterica]
MAGWDLTIREVIAHMTSRLLILPLAVMLLSGCVGKASHPQCQNLKGEAFGARLGADISGRYIDDLKANIADARYERCEEMFDLVQYQAQQQQQIQTQIQAQVQEQEREASAVSATSTTAPRLQYAPLKGLIDCERSISTKDSEQLLNDGPHSSYECEREVKRRVSAGIVSQNDVSRMMNQS